MVKILHTADWQIGLRASHVAKVGDSVRRARMDAARGLVERANQERVDALVLAGDIFEDNHVDNSLVYGIVRILSGSQVPVFVLPGNHDPLSQDSVYKRASWKERPTHIQLLENTEPVSIAQGAALLLPSPLSLKKSTQDPSEELRVPESGSPGILIGVTHGSLKIEGKYGRDDFPIALDAAARKGLSYLALGHWHGRYVHGDRIAYSGTLETTKFGEDNSGMALLVEFTAPGAAPKTVDILSGKLLWLTRELNLSHGAETEIQRLKQDLTYLAPDAHQKVLLRLRTTGESSSDAQFHLRALEEELNSKYLYFEIERRDLPSALVQGKVAEITSRNPFIAGLFESLSRGGQEQLLRDALDKDITAARRALSELLMNDERSV